MKHVPIAIVAILLPAVASAHLVVDVGIAVRSPVNAETGITEWWVDALFDGCPPVSSAHRHFRSQGHAFWMSVSDFAGLPGVAVARDGPAGQASFANPVSLGIDIYGNFYVLDRDASTIRKVSANGDISTISGVAGQTGANDGTGTYGSMNHPAALTVSAGGYVCIADTGNELIRKFYPSGNGIVFGPFLTTNAGTARPRARRPRRRPLHAAIAPSRTDGRYS